MKIELTLEQAYARASNCLRQKMEYSIHLLQKAERLALAYDSRGVSQRILTNSNPVVRYWGRLEAHYRQEWAVTSNIQTRTTGGFRAAPRLTA